MWLAVLARSPCLSTALRELSFAKLASHVLAPFCYGFQPASHSIFMQTYDSLRIAPMLRAACGKFTFAVMSLNSFLSPLPVDLVVLVS